VDALDLLDVGTGSGAELDATGHLTVPDRPGTGYRPDPAAHGWRIRAGDGDGQLVAVDRGRVIGFAALRPQGSGSVWRLDHLTVVPGARGAGAGRALLRTALTRAVLAGARTVRCSTPSDWLVRHGFRTETPTLLVWSPDDH
jgi:GNAT superfamily N-acetyltransferase